MTIRKANGEDINVLYALGLSCPELQTNPSQPFMTRDEFLWSIENPNGVFLLAEDGGGAAGFVYANMQDLERPMAERWACLVYLAVTAEKRSQGIATKLYEAALTELRQAGVKQLFTWAHAKENSPIEAFLQRRGFSPGGLYRWYDREI